MKTRDIPVEGNFKPKTDPQPNFAKKDPMAGVSPTPKNPFDELNSPKYKTKGIFAEKIPEEDPILNLAEAEKEKRTGVKSDARIEKGRGVVTKEESDDEQEEEGKVARASAPEELGPEWIRQDPPSRCRPYAFHDLFLKTLDLRALSMIHAARTTRSFTILLDALNNCVNVDIRDLTPADLTFVMFWVRDNSYPKSPMTIKYKTRYGHDISIPVRMKTLKITDLKMTKDEILDWKQKGITFPTVREMELMLGDSVPIETRWLLEYAQYVDLIIPEDDYDHYAELRIARLEAMKEERGLEIIKEIDEFAELIIHGVEEMATITDPKFVPLEAADYFEKQAKDLLLSIENIPEDDRDDYAELIIRTTRLAEEALIEAKDIRDAVAEGKKPLAKEETVAIQITPTDFFP